jgi:uncharacterized protein YbbK (DUF523 family)
MLVSACLLGACCTFDERLNSNDRIAALSRSRATIAVCPEEIAGLGTPRPAAHLTADGNDVIQGRGRVILDNGDDVTEQFVNAAQTVLDICLQNGVEQAYLKSKSPSCAYGPVKINKKASLGVGVTAALLIAKGIKVISCDADPREIDSQPSFEV